MRAKPLIDKSGAVFGVVLGIAVDHDGATAEEALSHLVSKATSSTAQDIVETYLAKLAGRYAIFAKLGRGRFFYCDPVGMIGAVYAPETRRIASTPTLCLDRPYQDHPLYDAAMIAQGQGMYGFDHTRDAHVQRLNANHRMDLTNFVSARFWPRGTDSFDHGEENYGAAFDEIIAAEQRIIARITTLGPTVVPLSGGNDSRMVLGLTDAETRKKLTLCYTHINNYSGRRDAQLAEKLASSLGVSHNKHDRRTKKADLTAAQSAAKSFAIASGGLGGAPSEIANGLYQSLPENSIILRGHQCNILRGQYVRFADPERWTDPYWHIRWMRLQTSESFGRGARKKFVPDFDRFYADFPENARARSADFFFFEALVPAALGTVFPGLSHAFYMSPFNSRRLVQLVMGFETSYRMTNQSTTDLLMRAEPGLAALPLLDDLSADMSEDPANFAARTQRLDDARARYKLWFGQDAPDVQVGRFNDAAADVAPSADATGVLSGAASRSPQTVG
ncbi:MAG: hypothetical protein U0934_16465 [Pseudotabrizicola sp.]|uniref:hypothetical protein n=1 Tax=Pseudotabrizicola sp. TaxID=2939647 RepID=UPI00272F3C69|nr:hypothetical protein [Pseudotabrizicola sp.]MDP2080078.1 hypothetical protein [Pseudotabrizicola sp.]MDZ7575524.1 hypothetical protein [Pseudotabrizicola sp.]